MDLGQKIDELAWDMEDKLSKKETSHKKKWFDKSKKEACCLVVLVLLSATILILCSQIERIHLFFHVKRGYICEEAAFYTLFISVVIMLIPLGVAAIISNIVLNKALPKTYIYNQLDEEYASEVKPLISEMEDNDVNQIERGMKWVTKLLTKATIEAVSFSCVFLIFDKIIIEEWTTFKITFKSLYSNLPFIAGNALLTFLLLTEAIMFCGALLLIKENFSSNQVIIKEYLVEKWQKS